MTEMLRARCNRCRWLFDVIALPAPVDRACEAMQSTCCPMCANRHGNRLGEPRELTAFEAAHYATLSAAAVIPAQAGTDAAPQEHTK